jgi:hypothetical protein
LTSRIVARVVDRKPEKAAAKALAALAASAEPLQRLKAANRLREAAEALEATAVHAARNAGVTWGEIGTMYGMSKQAAQQRFQRRDRKSR